MRQFDRQELAAIFAGGAVGALMRVWLAQHFIQSDTSWPWTIFAINVAGAFALGYFATRLQERLPQSTYRRPLLGTGFCGAFTTFSTMEVEILKMIEADRYGLAISYSLASLIAGLWAIWLASTIVRRARLA
ncbi:MAG: fluoride efflux transporter CrcB [Conexibacteraceae bacterium]|nr:fluoride efflux transporter CrcB [Conexibacteraceae bacterium]